MSQYLPKYTIYHHKRNASQYAPMDFTKTRKRSNANCAILCAKLVRPPQQTAKPATAMPQQSTSIRPHPQLERVLPTVLRFTTPMPWGSVSYAKAPAKTAHQSWFAATAPQAFSCTTRSASPNVQQVPQLPTLKQEHATNAVKSAQPAPVPSTIA